jgi:endoglucanase
MKYYLPLLACLNYCVSAGFSTNGNRITYNDANINLRGINWYGFETYNMVMEGLWQYSMDSYLDLISNHSFNAIRIPFSEDVMFFHNNSIPAQNLVSADPELYNKTTLEILNTLFEKAQNKNIGILLDCHRTSMANPSSLWYIPDSNYFTENNFYQNWVQVISNFIQYPNFIGIEIYNEPHLNATLGDGNPQTDVSLMYQNLLNIISIEFGTEIQFLIMIDGIQWGKDYRGISTYDPFLYSPLSSQIVYSPHLYGPTLTGVPQFTLNYITTLYDSYFGFLAINWNRTICVTEWGLNTNYQPDVDWVHLFIKYLKIHGMIDNFFWALNPEGKDIKGLLKDDWSTVSAYKLSLIEHLVSSPTKFNFTTLLT